MVRAPLSTPTAGRSFMHCLIRSLAHTMCDDLARATEALDGKKKSCAQWPLS